MPKRNRSGKSAVLTNLEAEKIYHSFNSERDKLIWMILLGTGERISAVLKLSVRDVYRFPAKRQPWDEVTFTARTRKRRPDGTVETRQVPITRKLMGELRQYQPPETGLLFPSPINPSRPITRQTYDQIFRDACEKCGLERMGFSLHSPRRSLATNLAANGEPLSVIQKITGHKSIASLQRYIDVSDEQIKSALNKL